jgi:hypothetical protein
VKRALPLAVLGCLAVGASVSDADPTVPGILTPDVPALVRLERGQGAWSRAFVVPEGAARARVLVASHQDVDVYLRRGAPVGDDFASQSDASSATPSGQERVDVDGTPGTWFLTVAHPGAVRGGATFAALVVVEGGTLPPLLLEDRPLSVGAAPLPFRVWFPLGAESIRIETTGQVVLQGPGGFRAEGEPGGSPLVLRRQDGVPWGLYFGQASPGAGVEGEGVPLRLHVTRPGPSPEGISPLEPAVEEEFAIGGDAAHERSWRLEVPPGTSAFVVSLVADEGADLDVYVRRGAPMRLNDEEADYIALTSGREERLVVGGESPIPPGSYYVDVTTVDVETRVDATLLVTLHEKGPHPPVWGTPEPPALPAGAWTPGRIVSRRSAFAWYAVDVPASARRLFVQVLDATSPVDLVFARRDTGAVVERSLTERVDETLDVTVGGDFPAPARYLLGVVNRTVGEEDVRFRVALSYDRPPSLPTDLRSPPFHDPNALNPTERVADAVVEVMVRGTGGGSATCVTPGGLLLSCRHVFQVGDAREPLQREGILVAFSDDFQRPPRQFYVARIVEADEALDLALLQITGDVYGRPLPAGIRLPHLPLGDSTRLALGEHVTAFGYPEAGSEHCRTGIIVSRGIVAGLEADAEGQVWIKTDAWISNGHSGGALVGAEHRLVGIPTATLGERRTLGLARPVSRLPPKWKALIAKGL